MLRDGIKQICSCLVDLIHQRRVHIAMGEKQWLLLQLGKVSEKSREAGQEKSCPAYRKSLKMYGLCKTY